MSPRTFLGQIFKILTLKRPLRKKLRMRWFFDVSKVKESSFFNRTSLTLLQIFDAHPFEITDFIFQWVLHQDHVLSQMIL